MLQVVSFPWELQPNVALLLWLGTLALALALVFGAKRALERARRRSRASNALSAERRAARLLEREGYSVVDRQVTCPWPVVVDRCVVEVALRADYLVERGSESFVAEVKNGSYVARIRHGPTRRQLLEYQLAYGVDAVLLVDVERERIERVHFPALN
jgi:hypothetical protein